MTIVQLQQEQIDSLLEGVTSTKQQELIRQLCGPLGQGHVFEKVLESQDEGAKFALLRQLEVLDESYRDGGLVGYVQNARKLLENSKKGVNPLEGWKPSVPQGQLFRIGTPEYEQVEALGLGELEKGSEGGIGFVLVAGGLGERLGYSSIKIGLPTELTTGTRYIEHYVSYILALQQKYFDNQKQLPMCIMTSNDTNDKTIELLESNQYFGMEKAQITIVQQGAGVPALLDNDARICMSDDGLQVVTKPHGHGDIHELLYRHRVARTWYAQHKIRWLVLFQDTNGLAFHALPLMLGVSVKLGGLVMNSLAVPRKAKQAIGGIAQLDHIETGESKTINVEYNQLDPMLRANGYEDGDVNDPKTGFSPFPGNINQLLFKLDAYADILDKTRGLMPEFVNPKYQDATKTVFKKPTRLECMMQDFPTVLNGEETRRVGFTSIGSELCFSPVKNATADGVALQSNGNDPGTAASGEADQYAATRIILRSIGCHVEDAAQETYLGIHVIPGPAIVFHPNFVCCPAEYKQKFPYPDQIRISSRSTLVVKGTGNVAIECLDLDGALVIDCPEGKDLTVHRKEPIRNEGWVRVVDETSTDEIIKMRGYRIEKKETKVITE